MQTLKHLVDPCITKALNKTPQPDHMVENDRSTKHQLDSQNELKGLMRCKFGHETSPKLAPTKPSKLTVWTRNPPWKQPRAN